MASFRISATAKDDLERIWLYGLENWGIEQADEYVHQLFGRFAEIAEHPNQYPSVNDIRDGYRRSVHGTDSIFYRLAGSDVEIMAIIGSQDLDTWL